MAMDLSMGHNSSSSQFRSRSVDYGSETDEVENCTRDNSPAQADDCAVVENEKFEKYSRCNRSTDGVSPLSCSRRSPKICEIKRGEKLLPNPQLENNYNTTGSGKQFSIEDILKPEFGRVQKMQPQNAVISDHEATNRVNTVQYLGSHTGVSHVGNIGYPQNRISFGDRLRPRNLVRPSPIFHDVESHRQLQCFRNNLLMAAQNPDFQREVRYRTDDTSRSSVFLGRQDPDISIPKRLQELVQRDPKRQTCYFDSQERGGQVCASGMLPDLSHDYQGRFPVDLASGGARHMEVQDVDLGDLDSGFGTEEQEEDKAWPAWVYCTRYSDRPSAGPRARKMKRTKMNNESFILDSKRPRTAFTDTQLVRLREEFRKNHYLTEDRRKGLAWELGLGETQVKIWFQNKRAKIKKTNDYKTTLADELRAHGLYNHSVS